jgi:hypothetical protein
MSRQVAKVAIVPGRLDAPEHARRLKVSVPPDAEPVAVDGFRTQRGVHALHDQGVLRLVEKVLQEHR